MMRSGTSKSCCRSNIYYYHVFFFSSSEPQPIISFQLNLPPAPSLVPTNPVSSSITSVSESLLASGPTWGADFLNWCPSLRGQNTKHDFAEEEKKNQFHLHSTITYLKHNTTWLYWLKCNTTGLHRLLLTPFCKHMQEAKKLLSPACATSSFSNYCRHLEPEKKNETIQTDSYFFHLLVWQHVACSPIFQATWRVQTFV